MTSQQNKVARGRPSDPDKAETQKQKLIVAARTLMREKSYKSITIRELGVTAGVNSAMVRYYFESKEGLILAAINDLSGEHFTEVQKIVHSDTPIKAFIEFMVGLLNQDMGLARFIHDEIFNVDSPLRTAFINGFPKRVAQFLPELIETELRKQGVTTDINCKYAAFNLMCLIIMPYLGAPVRQGAWGITDEELSDPQWTEHLYHQFMSGCLRENKT